MADIREGAIKAQKDMVVDLDEKLAKAKVVREGYSVPAPVLDEQKTQFLLGELELIEPKVLPRVISQSIPAGTKVPAGTAVDLVLAPKSALPFDIFDGVHADLKGKKLDYADALLDNPVIRQALLKYETPETVPAAEKEAIISALRANDIRVDPARPDSTFETAYNSVRGALAFR